MSPTTEQLLNVALTLPEKDRLELVKALTASLERPATHEDQVLTSQEMERLKAPPLTPELRQWAQQQHTDEEIIAGLKEVREKGGVEFEDFLQELEQAANQ